MNESGVWSYVKQGMLGRWHAIRIESSAGDGFPDVDFGMYNVAGKLEIKYEREWPKRTDTKLKLPLRPAQRLFFKLRGPLTGNLWSFFRVEDCFFLLDWKQALEASNGWTKAEYILNSRLYWHKRVNWEELHEALKEGC